MACFFYFHIADQINFYFYCQGWERIRAIVLFKAGLKGFQAGRIIALLDYQGGITRAVLGLFGLWGEGWFGSLGLELFPFLLGGKS